MSNPGKVAIDKGKAKDELSPEHASPDGSSIGDMAETGRKAANDATAGDSTSGITESELSASRGRSGDTVGSGAVRGPSRVEQASGTNNTTGRANILSNDASGLKIRLFERGTPITISVSRDVTVNAAASGVPTKVGDNIRVRIFADANKLDNIFVASIFSPRTLTRTRCSGTKLNILSCNI